MAAIVNAASSNGAAATSAPLSAPASLVKGNKLIAVLTTAATGSAPVAPPGWQLLTIGQGAGGSWEYVVVGDGRDPASFTWSWTTAAAWAGIIVQVSDVPTTGIYANYGLEAFAGQSNVSSTNITATAVTPRFTADLLLSIYCCDAANAITPPISQTGFGSSVGNTRAVIAGWEILNGNASTGTRIATVGSAATSRAYSFAFAPKTIAAGLAFPEAFSNDTLANSHIFRNHIGEIPGATFQFIGWGPNPNYAHQWAPHGACYWVGVRTGDHTTGQVDSQGYNGFFKIAGHCKDIVAGAPLQRQVFLAPELSPALALYSCFSDPVTGYFEFLNVAPGQYIIQGHDQYHVQNDYIVALVSAVPM